MTGDLFYVQTRVTTTQRTERTMIPTKPSESTRRKYVRNILSVYRASTADQRARGRAWYTTAHQVAEMLSEGNTRAGAGVIAALSAQKAWDINVRLATNAFNGDLSGHTRATLAKVAKIMAGADPMDVLPMDSKTGHFFRCIADPTDADAVCIDRHANDVAVGKPMGNEERGLSSKGRYAALAHCYRQAAMKEGILPQEMQAITWVVWVESLAGTSTRGMRYGQKGE